VTVVSDASPLITLAKIGRLELLSQLYKTIVITAEVYDEVVNRGAGLAGSTEIPASKWINVKLIQNATDLSVAQQKFALGIGELSTIILGKEVDAELLLIDEVKARRVAQEQGLVVIGSVGILEAGFSSNLVSDLREAYRQLLASGAYVDPKILENSLKAVNLLPL
jgi:predicted nucleic acid-binding protein